MSEIYTLTNAERRAALAALFRRMAMQATSPADTKYCFEMAIWHESQEGETVLEVMCSDGMK